MDAPRVLGLLAIALAVMGCISAYAAQPRHILAPPAHGRFSYQLGGAFDPGPQVEIVGRDRGAIPLPGRYNICYVNAYQAQPDKLRWWRTHHLALLLSRRGRPILDSHWNEQLLDTSTPAKRRALMQIVGGWIDGCARAGYQAIEPDNLDSWERSRRELTPAENLAFAALLITRAHHDHMAIAQKNAAELAQAGRRLGFDFAIAEECQPGDECAAYLHAYGREVIEIEYPDNGGREGFLAACRARGDQISITYRDRQVTPAGQAGHIEQHCDGMPA